MSDPTEPRYLPPNTEALADGEVHPTPTPTEPSPGWSGSEERWRETLAASYQSRPAASPGEVQTYPRPQAACTRHHPHHDPGCVYCVTADRDLTRATARPPASLLGSRDDDQRGEVKRLRDAWGASHARMERLVLDARRERDAEKARADAAVEALAGVRALCERPFPCFTNGDVVRLSDLRVLLPTDTTEGAGGAG